jgi:hypothetical protein
VSQTLLTAGGWAVSMTPLTCGRRCQWHLLPVAGGISDTADHWTQGCHWYHSSGWQIRAISTGSGSTLRKFRFRIRHKSNIIPQCQWWAVLMAPRIQPCKLCTKTLRCQWHRWSVVGGVNDTTEKWWAVSMTPRKSGGRCQWHRWPGASKFDLFCCF